MAKFKKGDYKKHYNLYSICGIIGDILFYPIIIITLICVFAIFAEKDQHKVPSFLGFSMVSISSGSMTKAGFQKDDVVFLKKTNVNSLRAGDIICFYYANSGVSKGSLTKIQTYNIGSHKVTYDFDAETFNELRSKPRTMQLKSIDQVSKYTDIYFHRIIGIYMADDGTIFYQTEGDTNYYTTGPDALLIAESLVVGKYVYTPEFLRSVFHYVQTSTGMLVVIVLPLGILMLFMLFSIIEQISKINLENKVLRREIRYDDPESIKANIGIDMEPSDKAKFFATSEEEERNGVANFLWGHLSRNKKEVLKYQNIMNALTYLDDDPNKYWLYFLNEAKNSKRQKKLLHKAWKEWIQEEKIKQAALKLKKKKKKEMGEVIDGKKAPSRPQREEDE